MIYITLKKHLKVVILSTIIIIIINAPDQVVE